MYHARDAREGRTVWEGYIEPTFGQRLLARVVDGVLVALVVSAMEQQLEERTWAAVSMTLVALYETGLVAWRGQTLGKTVLNLRVVDVETGGTPAPIQAFVRWLTVAAAGVFALVMPATVTPTVAGVYALVILVPLLKPPYHRGVHDRIAGTLVTAEQVRVPSDRPSGSRHPVP